LFTFSYKYEDKTLDVKGLP